MNRRTVIITALGFAGLSACNSRESGPPSVSNETIEQCEVSYLRERKSGDPHSEVISTEAKDDGRTYTVESAWGHSYRESEDTEIVVDHYEKAYYHVSKDGTYRTDEADSDPTNGKEMDC